MPAPADPSDSSTTAQPVLVPSVHPLNTHIEAAPRTGVQRFTAALLWITTAYCAVQMLLLFGDSVDVPFGDQWNFISFLRATDDGASWSELWAPHNEHRILVPRLVMLALARLTNWNIRAEIALVHALIMLRFAVVFVAVALIGRHAKLKAWTCVPLLAAFLLSRGQAENLVWGWQITLALGAMFALLCCLTLVNGGWARFSLAALFAVASQLSFASGVVLWPVGALFIALQPKLTHKTRAARVALWIAIGTVVTYFYNRGLPRLGGKLPTSLTGYFRYTMTFLGTPLAPLRQTPAEVFAFRAGLIGTGLFGLSVLGVVLTKQFTRWAPLIMWGVTAPATAAVTALARFGLSGNAQAMSSRYVTLSATMWATTAALFTATGLQLLSQKRKPVIGSVRLIGAVAASALSVLLVLQMNDWADWSQTRGAASMRNRAVSTNDQLLTAETIGTLSTDPALVKKERPYLIKERLTVFRDRPPISTTLPSTSATTLPKP